MELAFATAEVRVLVSAGGRRMLSGLIRGDGTAIVITLSNLSVGSVSGGDLCPFYEAETTVQRRAAYA